MFLVVSELLIINYEIGEIKFVLICIVLCIVGKVVGNVF